MVDLDFEIKRLRLSAGDVVVMKTDAVISAEMAAQIQKDLLEALPAELGCKVLILTRGMELSVLTAQQIKALAA